jgi:ATPase family associated with various cellular activities (AAA)
MPYYLEQGHTFTVTDDLGVNIHETLPAGNYIVKQDRFENFFLQKVESFVQIPKVYGTTLKYADRILNTYESRTNSTGVMLTGEKGSGKTLLGKTLSINAATKGLPTIIINAPWTGDNFNKFIQDISQPAIILFDEFEKVYDSKEQEAILTLLDGVFPQKKLFILTCNDKYRIDSHMRNRPGRIYYMIDFKGLEPEFIREYCEENLVNQAYVDKVVTLASLFDQFNFDMLKTLVEEMNRYDESPQDALKLLNAKPEHSDKSEHIVHIIVNGKPVQERLMHPRRWEGNPLKDDLTVYDYTDYTKSKGKKGEAVPDEVSERNYHLEPGLLTGIDAKTQTYTYSLKEDRVKIVLERVKTTTYNYYAAF